MNPPQYGAPDAQMAVPAAAARLLRGLLAAYALFVVYGSLVPLNFHPIPLSEAWNRFVNAPFLMLGIGSRADWVANLLLFVPLAFLGRSVCRPTAGQAGTAVLNLGLWSACTLLAAGIEFTQTYFPGRTVSLNDPLAESLGAAMGLALHRLAGRPMLQWLSGWWGTEAGRPLHTRLLHGYLVALLLMALMPLDLTLSPVEIYHKAKEGRVVLLPFADLPTAPAQAVYDLLTDVLLWLPVGLLWRWSGRTPVQVLLRGALVAGAVELLQLFVWSRVSSSTDMVTGALGCVLGALAAGWGRPAMLAGEVAAGAAQGGAAALTPASNRAGADLAAAARLPWGWLCLAWLVVALAAFWFPFELRLDASWLQQRWQEAWREPFHNYYQGSEFHALNELLRKLLFFMPGGLLWSLHAAGEYPWRRPALMRAAAIVLPLVAVLVEAGQLLMPGKYADVTDVAIESAGAWLGLLLGRRLWHGVDAARTTPARSLAASVSPPFAGTAVAVAPISGLGGRALAFQWLPCGLLVLATAWTGWQALPAAGAALGGLGPVWLVAWLLVVAAGALAVPWHPWAPTAAFFACQFITPRYGPTVALLLATPALPGLAALAALGQTLGRRRQGLRWRPELLPDGLFVLFFAWVGMLGLMAWLRLPAGSFDPLYHPANYAWCALLYAAARQGSGDAIGQRRLAMAVMAALALTVAVHAVLGQFALNGHLALLMVLAVPLSLGLARSARRPGEPLVWWTLAALAALGVVLNQNRSALLALLAAGLLALPWPRRTGSVMTVLVAAVVVAAVLWQLGMLDRFLSLGGPGLATRQDGQAVATVQSRLALWDSAWQIIQAHPVAGVGPGLFERALAELAPRLDKVPAHNTWLTLLAETGVVGALLGTLAFLAAWGLPVTAPDSPGAFPVRATARAGLLACAVFGLFNSRADFAWAYLLAGLAVPAAPPRGRRHARA